MSLDVQLIRKVHLSYDEGKTYIEKEEELYWANITHNLNKMAAEAGIYQALWRPEEINSTKAKNIIKLLEKGLKDLESRPEYFKQFNSSNGWGLYENLVPFVEKYLKACKEFPNVSSRLSALVILK